MHCFHLKHEVYTVERLWKLSRAKTFTQFAAWLGVVLTRMWPLLEEIHFKEEPRTFQYELIHEDRKLKRVSLWAALPEEFYQRLKQVYRDLNRFSMAQLVRELIRVYLFYVDSEEGAEIMIGRLWERVGKWKARYRKSGKPIRNKLPARLRTKKIHMKKNFKKELPMATYFDPGSKAMLIFLR